jgi:hypothetical protein
MPNTKAFFFIHQSLRSVSCDLVGHGVEITPLEDGALIDSFGAGLWTHPADNIESILFCSLEYYPEYREHVLALDARAVARRQRRAGKPISEWIFKQNIPWIKRPGDSDASATER